MIATAMNHISVPSQVSDARLDVYATIKKIFPVLISVFFLPTRKRFHGSSLP